MKRILFAGVATVALLSAASAADLGRPVYKAPPPVAPPPFSWTGCFAGAHWGWGWGNKDIHEIRIASIHGTVVDTEGAAGRINTNGPLFGGQVGCDYQFGFGKGAGGPGAWVVGIQGDFAGAHITGSATDPFFASLEPFEAAKFGLISVKQEWIASLTGRLGFTAWIPQVLWYVRGGAAWTRDSWNVSGANFLFERTETVFLSPVTQNRTGWTVGAGVEWAFLPNWSAFLEWDHYDFGTKNLLHASFSECTTCTIHTADFNVSQRVDTVKIGVNYRFGWVGKGKAPVVARY
jgi:outer membrane immunogenic protein